MSPNPPKKTANKGQLLIQVLVFSAIAAFFISGIIAWAGINIRVSRQAVWREMALGVAEAGVDYYRWHLAHAPQDYQDGTGAPGPYSHNFLDKNGNIIGRFVLEITPPPLGSTLVKIKSTGYIDAAPAVQRSIITQLAKPSIAKYAWVINSFVNFGSAAEVFGPIHSNNGMRFDGLAHNIVTSAVAQFDDPTHSGGNEFGVHTHDSPTDPLPPMSVPNRPDVFEAGRQFPVPVVDFAGLTIDLAQLKADAQASGRYFAPSGALGYHIVLKTDDTFDVYRVNSLVAPPGGCSSGGVSGWGTWSISTGGQTFLQNYAIPANGIVFVEDNFWIDGQINSARITIASAKFPDNPSTRTNIIVNDDLLYTNYDGSDTIGLIAQNNFNVGLRSQSDLRVDAAVIAQNGRVGRFSYSSNCGSENDRTIFTSFGMLGSNTQPAFFYGSNGYYERVYNYDANLLYAPPPSFPLTSDQYTIISWEEVQ